MDFEKIKNLLGEAYTEDVENAIKALVAGGGSDYVPKSKYDEVKKQLDALSARASNFQGVESEKQNIEKQYSDLKAAYDKLEKDSEAKYNALKNDSLLEREALSYKPRNLKALLALIDKEKLNFSEKGIEGLKEQIEELQKSDSFLFEQQSVGTGVPCEGTAINQASPADDPQTRKYWGLNEK